METGDRDVLILRLISVKSIGYLLHYGIDIGEINASLVASSPGSALLLLIEGRAWEQGYISSALIRSGS